MSLPLNPALDHRLKLRIVSLSCDRVQGVASVALVDPKIRKREDDDQHVEQFRQKHATLYIAAN